MAKRKLPDTSHAAYDIAKKGMISDHHQKIISALGVLGNANYEKIAEYLTMDRHQIGRRLSELEKDQIVCKPGNKSLTKSGRMAYNYSLTSHPKTDNEAKKSESESIHHFANSLIEIATKQSHVQKNLFE